MVRFMQIHQLFTTSVDSNQYEIDEGHCPDDYEYVDINDLPNDQQQFFLQDEFNDDGDDQQSED